MSARVPRESVGGNPATESATVAVAAVSAVSIVASPTPDVSATESATVVVSAMGVTGAGVGASLC